MLLSAECGWEKQQWDGGGGGRGEGGERRREENGGRRMEGGEEGGEERREEGRGGGRGMEGEGKGREERKIYVRSMRWWSYTVGQLDTTEGVENSDHHTYIHTYKQVAIMLYLCYHGNCVTSGCWSQAARP